ncbi:MAG: ATP-binding protein [Okeania sp. SIO3I5]|uniref:AAA family ATPase n=1 Tax=Okeania sp. SIO3I5 TaxID=2607805 RepID=UPI0013B8041A|nr:ATP-binding protein [Okeania sp. SIO3I5]NEQ38087.1 ATP-binding protein [Okeania sp. SIO3I5]
MINPKNPFTVGKTVPPERFVGRKYEINSTFDQIASRGHVAIWGSPGMGKSSLLEVLKSPEIWQKRRFDPSVVVIVYFSCFSIQPFLPSKFWQEILKLLAEKFQKDASLYSEINTLSAKPEVNKDDLRQALKLIGKQNKHLVLLVDDYHIAIRENSQYKSENVEIFLSECRNLANDSAEKNLSMIVTSLRRLNEIGPDLTPDKSPWFNHYLFLPLKPFTEEDVTNIFSGVRIKPKLKDRIRQIAGSNPTLLQNAGFIFYNKLQAEEARDVETFTKDFLAATKHFFQKIWQLSTEEEQAILMLIALSRLKGRLPQTNQRYDLGNIDIILSQKEQKLNDLEERGIIISNKTEDKITYSFASSLMEWWVIQEIKNSNDEELEKRKKIFLNLMSKKQLERVKKVVLFLWEHKDDVASGVELFMS